MSEIGRLIAEPIRALAVSVGSLNPDPANARKHGPKNLDAIKASLAKFGQRKPIVVQRDGMVVRAGNGTLAAAKALGWTEIAAVVIDDDNATASQFAIADNRSAELAEWDDETLASLLDGMDPKDRNLLGFDEQDLAKLMRGLAPPVVEDEAPEPPDTAVTKAGDVIALGDHRLLCGSSADRDAVTKMLGGSRASVVFTDPPYGVAIGAKNRLLNTVQKSGRNTTDIVSDDMSPDELKATLLPAFVTLREVAMADDCTVFVTAPQGGDLGMMMMMMMREAGLGARHVLIWKKNAPTFSMGRLDYDYAHEPILLTWGKKHKRPMGGKHRSSVWEIDKPRASPEHPTMKPVELYVNAYLNNSDHGDVAYEPFAGSGTAFIAGEQTGRKVFGVEIEPRYCDVIVARWEKLTGKKAVRPNG